jgi:hypothetical protein
MNENRTSSYGVLVYGLQGLFLITIMPIPMTTPTIRV